MIEFDFPQPEYKIGQTVLYNAFTKDEVSGLSFTNKAEVVILSIRLEHQEHRERKGDSIYIKNTHCYVYGIAKDPYSNIFEYVYEPLITISEQQD